MDDPDTAGNDPPPPPGDQTNVSLPVVQPTPLTGPTEYSIIPLITISFFWFFIGCILPWFVGRGIPNRRITQTCLLMTAVCCWIFWVTVYIAQMNPLIGPRLSNVTLLWISKNWGKPLSETSDTKGNTSPGNETIDNGTIGFI